MEPQRDLLDLLDEADEEEQENIVPPLRPYDPVRQIASLLPAAPLQKDVGKNPEQYLTDLVLAFLHPQPVKADDPLFSLAVEKTLQQLQMPSSPQNSWEQALEVTAHRYVQQVEEARTYKKRYKKGAKKEFRAPVPVPLFFVENFHQPSASVYLAAMEIVAVLKDMTPRFPFLLQRSEELFPLFTLQAGVYLMQQETDTLQKEKNVQELKHIIADPQISLPRAVQLLFLQLGRVSGTLEEKQAYIETCEALQQARKEAGKNLGHLSFPPQPEYLSIAKEIKKEIFQSTGRAIHFPLPSTQEQYHRFLERIVAEPPEEYWKVEEREIVSGDAAVIVRDPHGSLTGEVGMVNLERGIFYSGQLTWKDGEGDGLFMHDFDLRALVLKPLTRVQKQEEKKAEQQTYQLGEMVEIVIQGDRLNGNRGLVQSFSPEKKLVSVYFTYLTKTSRDLGYMEGQTGDWKISAVRPFPLQQQRKALRKEIGDKVRLSPQSRFAQQNTTEGEVIARNLYYWELPYRVRFADGIENSYDAEDLEFTVMPQRIAERREEVVGPRKISPRNFKRLVKKAELPLREYQQQCTDVLAQEFQKLQELRIPKSVILALFNVTYPQYEQFFPKGENVFAQMNALQVPEQLQERMQNTRNLLEEVLRKEQKTDILIDLPEIVNEGQYIAFLQQQGHPLQGQLKMYKIAAERELREHERVIIIEGEQKNRRGIYNGNCNNAQYHVTLDGKTDLGHYQKNNVRAIEPAELDPQLFPAIRQVQETLLQQEREKEQKTKQQVQLAQKTVFYLSALGYEPEMITHLLVKQVKDAQKLEIEKMF